MWSATRLLGFIKQTQDVEKYLSEAKMGFLSHLFHNQTKKSSFQFKMISLFQQNIIF